MREGIGSFEGKDCSMKGLWKADEFVRGTKTTSDEVYTGDFLKGERHATGEYQFLLKTPSGTTPLLCY